MKVRVTRSFIDKYSMKSIPKGTELEVTEERFSELTAGPRGIFVEKMEEKPLVDTKKEPAGEDSITPYVESPKEEEPPVEHIEEAPTVPNFEYLNKTEIVEYAKKLGIELNMKMNRAEMIEILLKK